MQRSHTDAMLRLGDNQPRVGLASRRHAAMQGPSQPASATTNVRATLWLIASLLVVWAVIVTT
jgi:hypothetical protein